ncbi:hypothetical protein F891_03072 [Acinetobacter sp. CIP 101966]|nr:hypothetical protein F924_00027 [Acinetobacter lwoffii ATCC 9957 = CIP 70.31]ENX25861.1 hypothetical protein F891_03072 [Acinetobacter sp. CIP 101966]
MNNEELSFKQGYEILKKNAELLELQEEPDIDNLMVIVEESRPPIKPANQGLMRFSRH